MPNLPSVNANNISKLPSTSSTEDSVELLNLFTHYDEDQCAETVCMLLRILESDINKLGRWFDEKISSMERNNQDRVQLLLSQAQNISTLLGPSYSLTINGPDEANNESPVANVEREIPKKIEFENIWCNSEYENYLYLRMVNIWIEKALPVQRQNKRTLDIEYSWGKYKYTASERGVRNKYFTVYKKLTLTQDVRDGLKTVEEKARE